MPYVSPAARVALDEGRPPLGTGDLNYLITSLIVDYLGDDLSYAAINDVIGVLECAKLELYRRIAAPYEDDKREQNGDVYGE